MCEGAYVRPDIQNLNFHHFVPTTVKTTSTNEIVIEYSLPPTALVEEGKHAFAGVAEVVT